MSYTKDELKNLVILALNQPGRKISEIKGTGAYVGTKSQAKYQELPIWHSKPEVDQFILGKIDVNPDKLKEYPSRNDGRGPFYADVAHVMTELRKNKEIIDWNVGTGIWRLTNSKYLIEKFPQDTSDGVQVTVTNNEIEYFLLRQKSKSNWNDKLGKIYEFGDSVAGINQLRNAKPGSKVILHTTEIGGNFLFWGHGTIDHIKEFPDHGKYHLVFSEFTFFNERDYVELSGRFPKSDKGKYFDRRFKMCEGYNYQNSINRITQGIYEEIISKPIIDYDEDKIMEDATTFEDKKLQIPSDDQIKRGLEQIGNELLIPNEKILEIVDALSSGRHILLAGPIGTGKTRLAQLIPEIFWSDDGGYLAEDHTATSDWNTQDVIGGIFPKINEEGEATYSIQNGCVVETVQKNWEDGVAGGKRVKIERDDFRDKPYNGVWLIIDEFNRADIDKAFGQLFTSLRTRKLKIPTVTKESYRELDIPKDFRIIGTLNTQDKHFLFELSDALKSRFAYIEIDIPEFEEKEKEMYYAANTAITDLELDQKRSGIQLNHNTKKIINSEASRLTGSVRLQTINEALETAYTILDYVREFKKLGTVILILMFKQIFVSSYRSNSDMKNAVENALMTNLIPQLENLSAPEIEGLISLCRGENGVKTFIQKSYESQNKQSYFKTMHLINNITNRYGIGDKLSLGKDFENNELILETLRIESVFPKYELPRFIKALEDLKESMIN